MGDDKTFQTENNFARIGFPGTGPSAEPAVQATPQFFGIFKNTILCTQLDITDHFPREMVIYQWADGRTGPAVKAFQGRVFVVLLHLFGKIGVN